MKRILISVVLAAICLFKLKILASLRSIKSILTAFTRHLYICAKAPYKMKTTVSVFAAFFFISVLSVSCQGDPGDFNTTFSEIEKLMNT